LQFRDFKVLKYTGGVRFNISIHDHQYLDQGVTMTLCPVAIAAGCRKCPIFSLCPAKSIIGDYQKEADSSSGTSNEDKQAENQD